MEEFKTKDYQRRAYANYLQKNKDNEEFIKKRKDAQKRYYERNKLKILKKHQDKRDSQKTLKSESIKSE